jgi:hypothetical protein
MENHAAMTIVEASSSPSKTVWKCKPEDKDHYGSKDCQPMNEEMKQIHIGEDNVPSALPVNKAGHEAGQAEYQQPLDLERLHTAESISPAYSIFTKKQKRFIVLMVSCAGFFSSISANIYFPALNALSRDLHVSQELINLTLTSYMIFQGLAPTLVGDLADMAGRRPAFILCFIIYIGANIGIALQDSYAALLILRSLQSTGSSGTIALGAAVVADIATSAERKLGAYNSCGSHVLC